MQNPSSNLSTEVAQSHRAMQWRNPRISLLTITQFSFKGVFAFLQGVFEKTGGKTWFLDGEFVVESW
jgi:hypothetical protein